MHNKLYTLHKWLGLIICIPILLWAVSGLIHPVLRLTKPVLETHKLKPPLITAQSVGTEPSTLFLQPKPQPKLHPTLQHAPRHALSNIRMIAIKGRLYFRISQPDGHSEYFSADSGEKIFDGEQHYAEYLARHYLGDKHSRISGIELITEFNSEYAPINRFLPVWRVNFDREDGIRLYVDTESSRLATAVDDRRAGLLQWFGLLHRWYFLKSDNRFRIGFFFFCMIAMFAMGLSGLVLYGLHYKSVKKSSYQPSRLSAANFHRSLGLAASLASLMFAFSGAAHVLYKLNPDERHNKQIVDTFSIADFKFKLAQAIHSVQQYGAVSAVSLVKIQQQPYYRLSHGKGKSASYIHSRTGDKLGGSHLELAERLHAKQLASQLSNLDASQIRSVKTISRFNAEYRFIDRRLPVSKVEFNANGMPAYYVDLNSNRLALSIDDTDRLEQLSFLMLHKWRFADGLGKNGRDALIALFVILYIIIIVLGIKMFFSRFKLLRS